MRSLTLQRQDDFLAQWGLRDAVRDMKHRELEAARAGDTMQQLEIRTERIAAETLLHPRGLGDFRVLVVEVETPPSTYLPRGGRRTPSP